MPNLIGWIDEGYKLKLAPREIVHWTARDANDRIVVEIHNHKRRFKWTCNFPGPYHQEGTAKTLDKAKRYAEAILKRNGFRLIDPKVVVMK